MDEYLIGIKGQNLLPLFKLPKNTCILMFEGRHAEKKLELNLAINSELS